MTITRLQLQLWQAADNPSCDVFGVGVTVAVGLGEVVADGVGVAVFWSWVAVVWARGCCWSGGWV